MTGAELAGRLLEPRSIALVGATEASLWSQNLVANLGSLGYPGQLHLVNPRRTEMFGRRSHPSLLEVPGDVDCAYVMVGTALAEEVVEQCAAKGVRSAVLLTAGFREVGDEGAELEQRLIARCQAAGIGVLGPNCLGFVNYQLRCAAYGLLVVPPLIEGGVALISQSGAMLLHFHRMAQARAIGLARMVSIGNEAMLTSSDFIEALVRDPDVAVVGALLEGIRDPAGFRRAAAAAMSAGKPLVVCKVGRTETAQRTVSAHTGSLAGEDEVIDAVFRQDGVVRVRGLEELVETCAMLATSGWPRGGRTAVLTTSGGACGLIADLAEATAIELPDFAPETKERLASVLPVFGTAQNPLDTTGVIVDQPELLGACLEAVAAEGSFDAYLVNSDPAREPGPTPERIERRLASLAEALGRVPFGAVVATASIDLTPYSRDLLLRHDLHFANGMTLGVRALAHAIEYGRARARWERSVAGEAVAGVPPAIVGPLRGTLTEAETKRLLETYGIGTPEEWLAADAAEAAAAAASIGFPVVLKIQSRDIPHKTEAGGVRVGLGSAGEVERAFAEIVEAARAFAPRARIDGVLVARQVVPVAELIVGVKRDPLFGPVIAVGWGGIMVEVVRDAALRLPPISPEAAEEMLRGLRLAPVLEGARGRPRGDIRAAADVVTRVSRLALDLGDRLQALDVNPLFVLAEGQGALAGDALAVLD